MADEKKGTGKDGGGIPSHNPPMNRPK